MRKFRGCEESVSSVIGVVLLVVLTVMMVSMIALSVFAFDAFPQPVPHARIVIMEVRGDMSTLYMNSIVLKHKGGDILDENSTKIIITGKGYAYTGAMPSGQPQDIRVTYGNLSGSNYGGINGEKLGEIVKGGTWDAGETVVLYGSDGKNIKSFITKNQGNTVDSKWVLKESTAVSITIVHIPTNQIIATSMATVKRA